MRRLLLTCGFLTVLAFPCVAPAQSATNNSAPKLPAIVASGDYLPPFSAGGTVQVFFLRSTDAKKDLDIKTLGDSQAKLVQEQYDRMRSEWGAASPSKDSLDIVEVPDGGAVTSSQAGIAEIATSQLRGANAARLLVNTIAHQWWGVRVAPATRNDAWITNGMCRYAEFEYLQRIAKAADFQDAIKNTSASALAYDSVPLSQSAQFPDGGVEWNALTYDKGAMIFRMLRWQIGEPAFEQTLRAVLSRPEKTISTSQLEALAEASAHQNLRPFFTQWVDGTGAPALRNDWTLYRLGDNKGYRVAGEIHEDMDLFTMPVEVRVVTASKTMNQRVQVAGPETQYQIDTTEIPKTIALDPDRWLLRNGPEMQVRVHLLRGQNREAHNDVTGAIQEYKLALAIDSINSLASYRLGEVYMRQKNYQAAADAFRDALRGSGQPVWTIVWSDLELGKAFDAMGQRERAINQYREALQTQDNTGGALDQARMYLQHPYTPTSAPPAAR